MNKIDELMNSVILLLKCILILILLGVILPKIVDYLIFFLISKQKIHSNSIFVYNILNNDKQIVDNFIYLFKLMVR